MKNKLLALCISLRPAQWVKNVWIFAGIIFSQNLLQAHLLIRVSLAFIAFCLLASGIYLINDIKDRDADRKHPEKCTRPIASGSVSGVEAFVISSICIISSLALAWFLGNQMCIIASIYLSINIIYTYRLKHVVILDIMSIASGFVIRVIAGAMVVGVRPSEWLIICTITLSLFLGFGKRRQEISILRTEANNHRRVLESYGIEYLDQMIAVVTACTIMSYILYTISGETIERFQTRNLIYTTPFVLYGIFRYLYLIHQKCLGGNPTNTVLNDKPLILNCFVWMILSIFIIYIK